MKQGFIDLAKYRIEKAKNTLSDAKKYIDGATMESTVKNQSIEQFSILYH
jgi:hypothetical protein